MVENFKSFIDDYAHILREEERIIIESNNLLLKSIDEYLQKNKLTASLKEKILANSYISMSVKDRIVYEQTSETMPFEDEVTLNIFIKNIETTVEVFRNILLEYDFIHQKAAMITKDEIAYATQILSEFEADPTYERILALSLLD